ncbi:MAG: UDP-N-acetylmuramate--L-alanine ligase [bacterium]|nr:UDP-N-acetylmuramate--L-alanine ligase [bacterium]
MFKKFQHIHFVGIGGSGMSGIAEVLLTLGYKVSGSDLKETDTVSRLRSLGGEIFIGHRESNVKNSDVVVVSTAINTSNIEVTAAIRDKIPVIPRIEMLAELMRLKYGVAIAGTHGKTTTTSLVALVLAKGGLDPTAIIGGKLNNIGSHAKLGQGEYLVAEADESDGSFLKLTSTIGVITNIDNDHLDYWKSIEKLHQGFIDFANKVPFYGSTIVCGDDLGVRQILSQIKRRYITYGLAVNQMSNHDLIAHDIEFAGFGTQFEVVYNENNLGQIKLQVPGLHNVYNALAAIGVGLELGIPFDVIKEGLGEFRGVVRRLQLKGEINKVVVMDDYGHHPTEIRATLDAVKRYWKGRLVVVFQPHRFSRTKLLAEEFGSVFSQADELFIMDIYSAGEKFIPGVDAQLLINTVRKNGYDKVRHLPGRKEAVEFLALNAKPGDLILTLGAGDVWKTGEELLEVLKSKK